MNPTNKDVILTDSKSGPYKPRRRKSLSRMNDDTTTKSPKTRRSKSPVPKIPMDLVDDAEVTDDNMDDSDNQEDDAGCSSVENSPIPPSSSGRLHYSPEKVANLITKTSPTISRSPYNKKNLESNKQKIAVPQHKYDSPQRLGDCQKRTTSSMLNMWWLIPGLFLLCAVLYIQCGPVSYILRDSSEQSIEDRMTILRTDIKSLKQKFQLQKPDSWYYIHSAVVDVLNVSMKPWTILLVSNDTSQISCLAELLGIASSKALLSNTRLVLYPKDFGNDYGEAIDRLKPQILKKKVVVVHDLLKIDAGAIQAFHTMCDRENPLVEKAVYIITIITPKTIESKSLEAFIENELTKTFVNRVPEDKLQPLVTRLTDGPIIQHVPTKNPTTDCSL